MARLLPDAYLPRRSPLTVWRQAGYRTLDRRGGVRDACLAVARGIDPRAYPSLASFSKPRPLSLPALGGNPLSLHAIDGELYATVEHEGTVWFYRTYNGAWQSVVLGTSDPTLPRTILPFTYYNFPSNPLSTDYNFPMVLIFPDGKFIRPDREEMTLSSIYQRTDGSLPYLRNACVYLSRVFGVGGDRAYASDHNCVTRWEYDTASSISASHAWVTASQSGTHNAGNFTAILPFAGQLLAFKEDFCQAIGGSKNPFRIYDLLSVGTIDARSVVQVGSYLLFASRRQVYRYDGDAVYEVGSSLHIEDFTGAMGGTAHGLYYLYVPSERTVFVYSPETDAWSELYPFTDKEIVAIASDKNGCLFMDASGVLYTTEEATDFDFSAETTSLVPSFSAPSRPARLRLTITAAADAVLSLSCRFSDGSVAPLAKIKGDGGSKRESVHIPAVADTCTTLCFEGQGAITIKAIELVTAQTATDGA